MTDQRTHLDLSRRERQIMDVLFQRGFATVAEVLDDLPDPPTYSSVRATLRVLEGKGHVRHRQEGLRYLFVPTLAPEKAKRSALETSSANFLRRVHGARRGHPSGPIGIQAVRSGAGSAGWAH